MAHFAELDENNIVLRVVVINDAYENEGEQWCTNFFGGGNWKQTSYNGKIRKNFAGVGYTYNTTRDAFIAPEPDGNLGLNEETCQWIMPIQNEEI